MSEWLRWLRWLRWVDEWLRWVGEVGGREGGKENE